MLIKGKDYDLLPTYLNRYFIAFHPTRRNFSFALDPDQSMTGIPGYNGFSYEQFKQL